MKASVLVGPKTCQVKEIALPAMGDGDVLMKVKACGVCRSDLTPWLSGQGPGSVIMGHEPSGIIEALGPRVSMFHLGQPVTVFTGGSGYYTDYTHGGFAEYLVVAQENVVILPENMPLEHALGEPLACLISAFERIPITLSDRVAVIGCGFMGLALLQLLRLRSPWEIVAIDLSREALDLALRMGANSACMPKELGPRDKADHWWEDKEKGFDVVIEVTGAEKALALAGGLVRAHGSLVIVGAHGVHPIDFNLWCGKGLNIICAHEKRRAYFMECMKKGIHLIAQGKLDMQSLVTHRYSLDGIDQAFEDLLHKPPGHIKGVVML